MKLYYHKTSGGAEYLCSESVESTDEGSLKSKYVVRIDGDIKKDAELSIRIGETIFITKEDKIREESKYCPRCIEDWQDETTGNINKGTKEISECASCGVCKECEHLLECSKSK